MKWTYPQAFTLQETGSKTLFVDTTGDIYHCPNNPADDQEPSAVCCVDYFLPFASQDKWKYSNTKNIASAVAYDMNGAAFAINPLTFNGKTLILDFCKVPNNVNCFTVRVNGMCLEMGFQRIDCDEFCDMPIIPPPPTPNVCTVTLTTLGTLPSQPQYLPNFTYISGQKSIVSFTHPSGTFYYERVCSSLDEFLTFLLTAMQTDAPLMLNYTASISSDYLVLVAVNSGNAYNIGTVTIGSIGNVYSQNAAVAVTNCAAVVPPAPVTAPSYVGVRIDIKNRIVSSEVRVKATYKLSNGTTKTSNTVPVFGELNDLIGNNVESFGGDITIPANINGGLYANIAGAETHTLVTSQIGGSDFSYWDFEITTIDGLGIIPNKPLPHPIFSNPNALTTNVVIPSNIGVLLIAVYNA